MVDHDLISLSGDGCVGFRRSTPEGKREIANRHNDRAELHSALRAEELVGEQPADQRRQVNQRGVAAVEAGRLLVGKEEMLGEIERKQRPHAVIAEPLPHFSREQPRELARMAEPFALLSGIAVTGVGRARFFDCRRIDHNSSLPRAAGTLAGNSVL